VTMLLGALMVLAPGAGADDPVPVDDPDPLTSYPENLYGVYGGPQGNNANLKCGAGLPDRYVDRPDTWDDAPLDILQGLSSVSGSYSAVGTNPLRLDWTSSTPVNVVIVKQSTVSAVYHYPSGATSGTVEVVLPSAQQASTNGVSHVSFCGGGGQSEGSGQLTAVKVVTGATEWSVPFTISGSEETLTNASDTSNTYVVTPGTHEISENLVTASPDMTFTSVACSKVDTSVENGSAEVVKPEEDPTDGTVSVVVNDDEHVTCTFTNTVRTQPDITIVKDEVPGTNIPSNEVFTFDGPSQSQFTLSVGGTHTDADLEGTEGGYVYTEVEDVDYPLAYIECGDLTLEDIQPQDERISALVSAEITGVYDNGDLRGVQIFPGDEDVSCTFFNEGDDTPEIPPPPPVPTPEADLRIVKAVEGDAPDGWTATFVGVPGDELARFQLGEGDETEEFLDIAPGTYRVEEIGSIDSELTGIECVGDGTWDEVGDTVEVTLVDGDDLTCTFTNFYPEEQVLPEEVERGSITIVKAVEGTVPTDGWAFGFNVSDGVGRAILTNTDADATFGQLDAGQYTIVEDANSFTSLKNIACNDEDAVSNGRTVTVDVSEGENVTCTFTNVFPALAQADTEVQGDVITRTLPRTG